jgi:2,4'-dihydroxyacetophenone dioxygenase
MARGEVNNGSMTSSKIDRSKVPYQLPQPTGMVADIVTGGALNLDGDEQEWVAQSEDVAFKPLVLNVTAGYYV